MEKCMVLPPGVLWAVPGVQKGQRFQKNRLFSQAKKNGYEVLEALYLYCKTDGPWVMGQTIGCGQYGHIVDMH